MEFTIMISLILVGIVGIVGIVVIAIYSSINSNKKLVSRLEQSFGHEPTNQDYDIESIARYHGQMCDTVNSPNWIDDITWDDLDMDKVFRRINACCSSVGEEYLYHMLHAQSFDSGSHDNREGLISYLMANPDIRLDLQKNLAKFGKSNFNGLSDFINNKQLKELKYPNLYRILALIPILGIVTIPFIPAVGLAILLSAFSVNIFIYYLIKKRIEFDLITLGYFSSMLWCCRKICDNICGKDDKLRTFIVGLQDNFKVFKSLSSKIPIFNNAGFTDMEVFLEYFKILFLSDMRNYNKVIRSIRKNIIPFHELYRCVGELDASISILSFRESLPFYCIPLFHNEDVVTFDEIYHPLLSDPIAITNDAVIEKSCIITGSNASGKSTFIKTIAINGILAQTINTCSARSYSTRFAYVMTSMAVRDNISQGDSYFITEIKSLKRILDMVSHTRCLCFIDEILKGTNTIERIAASAAVLKFLSSKDCLCMVASHDIELTKILENEYNNYHFSEQITDDGINFDYLLKQGPSQTRNAIKLLHFMDFDDGLVENAESLVTNFTKNHKW